MQIEMFMTYDELTAGLVIANVEQGYQPVLFLCLVTVTSENFHIARIRRRTIRGLGCVFSGIGRTQNFAKNPHIADL